MARYILKNLPEAKIAVFYENDDLGKDYLIGLREGLGDEAAKMIVSTKTYEPSDPTVDLQIVALHGSGADVLTDGSQRQIRRAGDPPLTTSVGSPPISSPPYRFRSRRCCSQRVPRRRSASSRRALSKSQPIRSGKTQLNTKNGWSG